MRRTSAGNASGGGAGARHGKADRGGDSKAYPRTQSFTDHRQRIYTPDGRGKTPHAIVRAAQRHNVKLTLQDLYDMAEQCRLGYNMLQSHPHSDLELHVVWVRGRSLPVVYNPRPSNWKKYSHTPKPLGVIVTVLPRGTTTLLELRKEEW